MRLKLSRDYRSDSCTMGVLSFSTAGEDFIRQTMERPWIPMPGSRGGLSGKSCVPAGDYRLVRHNSEAHPNTWALVNPDLDVHHYEDPTHPEWRALVLIHAANRARELRGCIALGDKRFVDSDGVNMVANSRLSILELKRLLPWNDEHQLEIR